ncbi:MAG: bifunctional UDP-N-acetylglucosamine diphosphorylase/glucosamine-1-phosphate N-acetyltransferase GlmU [Candidatus Nanopelagicaceae bacterium]|nr:bifunctional UDP-N-acetylglucosamine diphosphorylase/glucosamine-1-phosphate N-acetyltransferase GlmU [Candidatus Nanopelagicaceae bacterium]
MSRLDYVIVLAAGEGTRMRSTTPKVLHTIAGQSLLGHVLTAVEALAPAEVRVVIGAGREKVQEHLEKISPQSLAIVQEHRGGTGHAVQIALASAEPKGTVLIVAGDTPLLSSETLRQLVAAHNEGGFAATVLTAELPDPTGYGRIIRSENGDLIRIVEERDASEVEKEIDEINSGVYVFDLAKLHRAIAKLTDDNSQGELYLTQVIEILRADKDRVVPILTPDYIEILGINDRVQMAECAAIMRDQINDAFMRAGVSMIDPTTTWIDTSVKIAADAVIYPGTAISGNSVIAEGAIIGPRSTLIDCKVAARATVIESFCNGATIGVEASVGPFTYLRPGSVLGRKSRTGAYVEMKNATLGEGSKVPHLSYVGDATIGEGTNIGAATVFVNYDGVEKHHTTVGDHVRIGSDTMLVAPLSIGDGAYTAAGSVITEDVPAGAIGVGRAKQRNVLGWVLRKRPGTKSADAAESSSEKGKPTS